MLPSPYFYIFNAFIREQGSCPWVDLSVVMLINDFEDQKNYVLVYLTLIFILSDVEDIKPLTSKNIFNCLNVMQPFSKELPLSCYAC